MATVTATPPTGLAAVSRAVVAAAADLVAVVERRVVGEDKVRTARGNAWAAIQADRARAQARDEMDALVRSLMANGPRAGVAAPAGGLVAAGPESPAGRTDAAARGSSSAGAARRAAVAAELATRSAARSTSSRRTAERRSAPAAARPAARRAVKQRATNAAG